MVEKMTALLKYRIIPVTAFQQNCSLVWCSQSKAAALIDPGGETERLLDVIVQEGVKLEQVWLTHGHLDHVGATAALLENHQSSDSKKPLRVEGPHTADHFWINALAQQAQMLNLAPVNGFEPTRWLNHGDTLRLGEHSFDVFHCPGHTPGHIVIYHKSTQHLWVGDVLFKGSIGRTDFPMGNHEDLQQSIHTHLFRLPEETTFTPGHGPESSIGWEKRHNPFVANHKFG